MESVGRKYAKAHQSDHMNRWQVTRSHNDALWNENYFAALVKRSALLMDDGRLLTSFFTVSQSNNGTTDISNLHRP